MIRYDSFFCWSVIVKTGRPSLECFEAKRERVLSWREATTLIDHGFASCELVSCLIIGHLEITIRRGSDILGSSIVEIHVVF